MKSTIAILLLTLLPATSANTPLSDSFVQTDVLSNHGLELAWASRPMWNFGLSSGNKPCYPSAALVNGQQHGTNPDLWPNAGTGCADPGVPGGRGNSFPTYFSVNSCGADEIRIVYTLYFTHDGFRIGGPADGHVHDWERIIVVWSRDTGEWTRKRLLASTHDGYTEYSWDAIPSTFTYDSGVAADGAKNKDGAKIYVGWAKHALFTTPLTAWRDKMSQGCGREFRAADWWYIPERSDLVCAGDSCAAGNEMAKFDWGAADSGPWIVSGGVCAIKEGGNASCRYIDSVLQPMATQTLEIQRKNVETRR